MENVEDLLDQSITGYKIDQLQSQIFNLSKIDLDKLKEQFLRGHKRIQLEQLRWGIEKKITEMLKINRMRINFYERFKELVDEYNIFARSVEETYDELVKLARDLKEEEERYIREELKSEEELAVFDILARPKLKMTKKEEVQVKAIARELLQTLKTEKLVLDWRKKQQTRAAVKVSIAEILDKLPAVYEKNVYEEKCNLIFNYVYEHINFDNPKKYNMI